MKEGYLQTKIMECNKKIIELENKVSELIIENKRIEDRVKELLLGWEKSINEQVGSDINKEIIQKLISDEIIDKLNYFVDNHNEVNRNISNDLKKNCKISIDRLKDEFRAIINSHESALGTNNKGIFVIRSILEKHQLVDKQYVDNVVLPLYKKLSEGKFGECGKRVMRIN